jgi:uncharacterized protein involved in exopolysaccharide biosynthesis
MRLAVFLTVLVVVAGSGLTYNYARDPVYRATARISVEPPPGAVEDPLLKSQFAMSEAQVLRSSSLLQAATAQLGAGEGGSSADLERRLGVEVLAQTSVIELRAEGNERERLQAALSAWIDAYLKSRKASDHEGGREAVADARHALAEAEKNVEAKRREMEAFRQRHGIASVERDENPGAARLKGLHVALNDAATKEVTAEARLKSVEESIAQGKGIVRNADKPALANLDMRAVDLREKIKDLESDFTAQFLAMEPRYKALKANLARVEQQIQVERERSQKAALVEAQEEFASARRATQKIREQADAAKQDTQTFSARFLELKRITADLNALQDVRKEARDQVARLESTRKPPEAKLRVLATPSVGDEPIAPDYTRDAAIAIAAGLLLAIGAVWLTDYLRRDSSQPAAGAPQPVIQIAYPMLNQAVDAPAAARIGSQATPLLAAETRPAAVELAQDDITALWKAASADGRLLLAALLSGISSGELTNLRWKHVSLDEGYIDVPGPSGRRVRVFEPLRQELAGRASNATEDQERPLLSDGLGHALDEGRMDDELRYIAHDAGLRHPEEVTAAALHFTYAAFLARQGMRMTDLAGVVGRFPATVGTQLMQLNPLARGLAASQLEFVHPSFRTA